ncbi:hypothetical protein BGE01nite_23640 [Brevifollis gellanilyticus]|uniref:Uncharacterized protein n=2 Tax=Brevifollis gellanilyticus TaxID=748831 RepID=A0A512M8Q2_9BACT|nr:hypothetical protein BGE01nite_23640 [Brevifollis gellanilyticus]
MTSCGGIEKNLSVVRDTDKGFELAGVWTSSGHPKPKVVQSAKIALQDFGAEAVTVAARKQRTLSKVILEQAEPRYILGQGLCIIQMRGIALYGTGYEGTVEDHALLGAKALEEQKIKNSGWWAAQVGVRPPSASEQEVEKSIRVKASLLD